MNNIRRIDVHLNDGRAETGPLIIGDDWPGVFIRGDNALMWYAPALRAILNDPSDTFAKLAINELAEILESCNSHSLNNKETSE